MRTFLHKELPFSPFWDIVMYMLSHLGVALSLFISVSVVPTKIPVQGNCTSCTPGRWGWKLAGSPVKGNNYKEWYEEWVVGDSNVDPNSEYFGMYVQRTDILLDLGWVCTPPGGGPGSHAECSSYGYSYYEWHLVKKTDLSPGADTYNSGDMLGFKLRGTQDQGKGCEQVMQGKSYFVPSGSPAFGPLRWRMQLGYSDAVLGAQQSTLPAPPGSELSSGVTVDSGTGAGQNAGWIDANGDGIEDYLQELGSPFGTGVPSTEDVLTASGNAIQGQFRWVRIWWNDCDEDGDIGAERGL